MNFIWRPQQAKKRIVTSKTLIIVFFSFLVLGGLTFLWYAVQSRMDSVDTPNIPIISDDDAIPFKEKPENPGGYVSLHTDKTVYELISPPKNKVRSKLIKEEEEEPLKEVTNPEEEEIVLDIPPPTEGKDIYKVQISSLSSQEGARKEQQRLQKKHAAIFGNQPLSIEESSINGQSVFRIYVGAFADKETSENFCARLKGQGINCFSKKL